MVCVPAPLSNLQRSLPELIWIPFGQVAHVTCDWVIQPQRRKSLGEPEDLPGVRLVSCVRRVRCSLYIS